MIATKAQIIETLDLLSSRSQKIIKDQTLSSDSKEILNAIDQFSFFQSIKLKYLKGEK